MKNKNKKGEEMKFHQSIIALAVLSIPLTGLCGIAVRDSSSADVSIVGAYDVGIYSNKKSLDFSGKNIEIDLTPGNLWGKGQIGVYAIGAGVINLGSSYTGDIKINVLDNSITGQPDTTIGIWAIKGGKVVVESKKLTVTVDSTEGWGFGIASQGNDNENTTLVINAEDTEVTVSAPKGGNGLVALSKGILKVNGNLTVNARNAISTRGDSVVRINEAGTRRVVLNGNINFNYDKATSGTKVDSDVLVNLTGEGSQWTGNAVVSYGSGTITPEEFAKVTGLKLIIADKAQWNPTITEEYQADKSGVSSIALNNLTLNDGVINITKSTEHVVKAENLDGTGGTVNTLASTDGSNVSSGKLQVASVKGAPHLIVNALGLTSDDIKDQEAALGSFYVNALDLGENSQATATLHIPEGDVAGALKAEVDQNGSVTVSEEKNTINESLIDIASSNYLFFRSQINDVSARMGDLRSMPKTAGAWVRYYGGKNKYSKKNQKEKYNTLQLGVDTFVNNKFYLGGTFSYTDGDGTLHNGSTDDKNYNFGIYGGWLGDAGQFVDVIIKRHRLETDFDLYSMNGKSSGSYNNWGTSASIEAGWRFNCPSTGFYAEPQVELQLGRVDSVNYRTSKGIKVEQDGINSIIGRAGVAVGYSFPENKGNVYAKASVLHDWKGEVKSTFLKEGTTRTYKDDLGGTWGEFALGGTYNPTKNLSAYGQVKTSAGSPVRNPWQVSVGLRYSF